MGGEAQRDETNQRFAEQNATITALGESIRAEMNQRFAEQNATITALGESIRAETNQRFAEQNAMMSARFAEQSSRLNLLTAAFIGAAVAQFGGIVGLAATILPRL